MARKISITEGLNELKLYDAKISKAISSAKYVGATKKASDMIGVVKKDKFCTDATSKYQSVIDLIKNRNALKSAIVQSNAVTIVEIAGKKMTVAEAIEHKSSIVYDKTFLNELKSQYEKAASLVIRENTKVDTQIDRLLEGFMGKDTDKKVTKEDQAAIVDPYREKNEWCLVDPLGIKDKIEALEAEIDGFESAVDTTLVLSNSVTFIELD